MFTQKHSQDSQFRGVMNTFHLRFNVLGWRMNLGRIVVVGAILFLLAIMALGCTSDEIDRGPQLSAEQREFILARRACRANMISAAQIFTQNYRAHGTYELYAQDRAGVMFRGRCSTGELHEFASSENYFSITCPNGHGEIVNGNRSW